MARIKKQLAKGNLIKSLAISGGITSVITAVGLGISIPVYRKIQRELSKVSSQVADLSKFMSGLTAKLGIPADQIFEKELSGGYTLLYSNGKTMIFSGSGDQKSLVMNMNQDGTIGSAAKLEGPAAQQMLGIISEAKSTIGSEADSMKDIMQDFVDQTRDTSLANESFITGASRAELITRNVLSVDHNLTVAEKSQLLQEAAKVSGVNLSDIKDAEKKAKQLIQARKKRIKEEEQARKAGKNGLAQLRKRRALAEKQEALDYLNNQSHKHQLENVEFNGNTYLDISALGNEEALSLYYQAMKIKDSQVAIAKSKRNMAMAWLTKQGISFTNVSFKDFIGEGPNAQEITYTNLSDGNHDEKLQNFYAYHVANLAKAKSEDQQIQKATTSGKGSSILQKVASSVTSWPSMYVKAKYGYTRPSGATVSASSQLLKGLKNILMQKGVSEKNYLNMTSVFDNILEVSNGKPKKTFKLTTVLNTYNKSEVSQARLLVLKADITDSNKVLETKYLVARSSSRNIVDLEKVTLSNSNSKTIYYLAKSANINFSRPITRRSISALISLVESNKALKIVKDNGNEFNELIKLSLALESISNNAQKFYISKILFSLLENYLFKGKNINNFNSDMLIEAARAVIKTDNALNAYVTSKVTQNPKTVYSLNNKTWMKKLYDFLITEEFNYDYFNTFARNLSFFDELDEDLKQSVNQNKNYFSKVFDIVFDKPKTNNNRTNEDKLKLYLEAFAQISKVAKGSDFNITESNNIAKITKATEVLSSLQKNNMDSQKSKEISDLIIDIVLADVLTEEQFAKIVKYTDTIFALESDGNKVVNILKKVLRPEFVPGKQYRIAEIQENKDKLNKNVDDQIAKLNTWFPDAKNKLKKTTITQDELEAYIWTQDKKTSEYELDNNKSKKDLDSNVSAVLVGDKTYIFDHNAKNKKIIWESIFDETRDKTTLKKITELEGNVSGGNYISSQFAGENGHIYWTQLTRQTGNNEQVLYEWDQSNPIVDPVQLAITKELKTKNGSDVRSLFILDHLVYFGLDNSLVGELAITESILNSGKKLKLRQVVKPSGINQDFKLSWISSGFVAGGNKFFITPLKDNNNNQSNIVVWTIDNSNAKPAQEITKNSFGKHIVSVLIGNYDGATKQQTFFVVGINGALIKYVVKLFDDKDNPSLSFVGEPLTLISGLDKKIHGETRGATYINGAITLYSAKKATYLKDHTSIFNLIRE